MKKNKRKLGTLLAALLFVQEILACFQASGAEFKEMEYYDFLSSGEMTENREEEPVAAPVSSAATPSDKSDSSSKERSSEITVFPNSATPSDAVAFSDTATPSDAVELPETATPSNAAAKEVQTVYWAINWARSGGYELTISSLPQEGIKTGEFSADRSFEHEAYISNGSTYYRNELWSNETIYSVVVGDAEAGDIVKPVGHFNWFTSLWEARSIQFDGVDTSEVTDMSNAFYNCSDLKSLEITDWDTSSVTDMRGMFYNCNDLTGLDLNGWNTSSVKLMGGEDYQEGMFSGCSSLTDLEIGNWNTSAVTDMRNMFRSCASLTQLEIGNWKPSSVRDMRSMFANCTHLITLDLGNWNTSSVQYLGSARTEREYRPYYSGRYIYHGMFYGCSNLESLDLGNWNTSSVKDMNGMFYGCSSLTSLNLCNWNTSSVTDMGEMFRGCNSLTVLDLGNWNTSSVTDMSSMFSGCSKLTVPGIGNWNTSSVINMGSMFSGCSSLTVPGIGNWNTSSVTDMSKLFYYCSSLTDPGIDQWNTSSVTNMSSMFCGCAALTSPGIENWNVSSAEDLGGMFNSCTALTSINLDNWNTSSLKYASSIFSNCSGLTEVNIGSWNISSVADLDNFFLDCSSLKTLDLNRWDTSSVTSTARMFSGCSSLTELNIGNWDTSSLTAMSYYLYGSEPTYYGMFHGCSSLKTLDLGNWDTPSLVAVPYLFSDCTGLESLDLSGWDMSSVESLEKMFFNCSSLKSLNIGAWDTSSVISMHDAFSGCSSLESLNIGKWDASSVVRMDGMFYGCSSLKELDIKDWNTSSLRCMGKSSNGRYCFYGMFQDCSSLTNLDLGAWNTSSVETMEGLFAGCSSLETLNIRGWDFSSVTEVNLEDCLNLNYIQFPKNITLSISLPENGIWYYNGSAVTELPTGTAEPGIVSHGNTEYVIFSYLNEEGSWTRSFSAIRAGGGAEAPSVPKQAGSNVFVGWQNNLYKTAEEHLEVKALYVTCEDPASITWHTLRFYDGSVLFAEQKVKYGTPGQDPGTPVSEDFFIGWSGSYDCITKDTTLFARYRSMKTVSFSIGEETITKEFSAGETIVYPTSQELEAIGFGTEAAIRSFAAGQDDPYAAYESIINRYQGLFLGWETEAPSVMPEKDISIAAEVTIGETFKTWAKRLTGLVFSVTFIDYDGTEEVYTVLRSGFVTAPEADTRNGYEFLHWREKSGSTVKAGWKVAGVLSDLTYTAVYEKICTVTFVYYSATGGKISEKTSVKKGGTAEAPSVPQNVKRTVDGETIVCKFTGWDKSLMDISEDTVITAQYTNYYKASFIVGDEVIEKYFAEGEKIVYPTEEELEKLGYGTESAILAYVDALHESENLQNTSPETVTGGPEPSGTYYDSALSHFKGLFMSWKMQLTVMPASAATITAEVKIGDSFKARLRNLLNTTVTVKLDYYGTESGTVSYKTEISKYGTVDFEADAFKELYPVKNGYKLKEENPYIGKEFVISRTVLLEYYEEYEVAFLDRTGTGIYEPVLHGDKITAPEGKKWENHVFFYWREENSGDIVYAGDTVTVYGTLTYIPVYQRESGVYEVTFLDGNGRDTTIYSVKNGETVIAPEGYERKGYEFLCWKEAGGSSLKAGESVTVESDLVYTAEFGKIYTVTFMYRTRTTGEYVSLTKNVVDGESVTVPYILETIEIEGTEGKIVYVFTEWDKSLENIIEDTVITALYEEKKGSQIEYSMNDGSVLEAVDALGHWYIMNVKTYLSNKEGTERTFYDYFYNDVNGNEQSIRVGDDCSAFACACLFLATNGAFPSLEYSTLNFFDKSFDSYGIVKMDAANMKVEDLQPGDLLVDRHEKLVYNEDGTVAKNEDGTEKTRWTGHAEFVVSEPVLVGNTCIIERTFGWGQVQSTYEKNNNVWKDDSKGAFCDANHPNYKWVFRKIVKGD